MKKLFLLTVLAIISTFCFAQGVKFGVYVSPQFCWLAPEAKDVSSDGIVAKFGAGLTMDNYFAKNYAFTTGISLVSMGGKINYPSNSSYSITAYDSTYNLSDKSVRYDLQYLNIPLGLKLRSNEIGYLRFHVIVGLTNQLRIKAKATNSDLGLDKDSVVENISFYNLGYHFGAGLDYALGEDTSVFCTLVYDNGFLDIMSSSPRITTRVISIRLGVNF